MEGPSELGRRCDPYGYFNAMQPLVDRQQEIAWFKRLLQEVGTGLFRIVLIPGDAGIGKTRLLHEVQALARHNGMQVYHSRCHEDMTVPYLPFVETLRAQLAQLPATGEDALSPESAIIRQLLPQTVTLTAAASIFTTAQAEQDRLRLFLAVSQIFLTLARHTPTLFVVDDLHWADPSSLDLLRYITFTLADAAEHEPVPLLLVCAYRPREGGERLERLLTRMQREPVCDTLSLSGLSEPDIHTFLHNLSLHPPSHQLTATVHQATRGNPLFIQEVFRYMVHHEALEERHGYVITTAAPETLQLPAEVASAIGLRAQRLSENCRRVLTQASLLGDRVSLQMLETVSSMNTETVLDALDEGIQQHLLVSAAHEVQFTHPLIRHVFYQIPSTVRRQRLHQDIAQQLEHLYADNLDAHLREIAYHLVHAGSAATPATVVAYARRAGDQAFTTAAWGEAAQYYEAALEAARSIPHFPVRERAELHYRAGLARYRDMDAGPSLDHYEKAVAAYRQVGEIRGVARALMEQTHTRYTLASVPLGTLADIQPLEVALEALGERETVLHGDILAVMSGAYSTAQQQETARALGQRALDIGQRLNDVRLQSHAHFVLGVAQSRSLHVQEGVACFEKALDVARRSDDLAMQSQPLTRLPVSLMRLGRLHEVVTTGQAACDVTRQYQDWGAYSVASSALTSAAVANGDSTAAERWAQETMLMVSRSHYPFGGARALCALACVRTLRGEWAAAEEALDTLSEPGRVFREVGVVLQTVVRILRQVVHAYADGAAEPLQTSEIDTMLHTEVDTFALDPLCALVELADCQHLPALAERAVPWLQRAVDQGVLFSIGWVCLLPRVLGVAAMLSQQWEQAEAHFQTALDVALRLEARLEIGRTYCDYARMLAAQQRPADSQRASMFADQAWTLLTALGMHPLAQRAADLSRMLRAGPTS